MHIETTVDNYVGRDNFIGTINVPYCDKCKAQKPDDSVEALVWYHETRKVQGVESSYDICPDCQTKEQGGLTKLLAENELKNIDAGINRLRQESRKIETRIARKELKYQMIRRMLRGMDNV